MAKLTRLQYLQMRGFKSYIDKLINGQYNSILSQYSINRLTIYTLVIGRLPPHNSLQYIKFHSYNSCMDKNTRIEIDSVKWHLGKENREENLCTEVVHTAQ